MSAYGQRAAEASAYMAQARQNADDNSEAAAADFDAAAKKTASDADSSFQSKWSSAEMWGGGEAGSIAAIHGVYKGGKLAYQAVKKRMGTSSGDAAKAGDAGDAAKADGAGDAPQATEVQRTADLQSRFDNLPKEQQERVKTNLDADDTGTYGNDSTQSALKGSNDMAEDAIKSAEDGLKPTGGSGPGGAGSGDASYADSFDFSGGLDSIGAENIAPITTDVMTGVADAGSGLLESLGGAELVGAAIPFVGEGLAIVGGVVAAVDGLIHIFKHKTTAPKTAPPPQVNAVLAPQPLTAKLSAGLPSQDGSVDLPAQAQSF